MSSSNDNYYLNGIKNRDNLILKEIYRKFLPKVIGFVLRNKGTEDDARDIFNNVIYQFSARLEHSEINIKSNFEAYVFVACKNLWRRELGRKEKEKVTSENVKELYYKEKDQTQATLEQERWELFQEKLSLIGENCQKILQMFFKKISGKDIMENLGYASETVVRQRIFKCKARLAKIVKEDSRFNELKSV